MAVQGEARLVDDLAEAITHWAEGWLMFFPDGPEGDDYVLIQSTPIRIEFMSFEHHVTPAPFGLLPVVVL